MLLLLSIRRNGIAATSVHSQSASTMIIVFGIGPDEQVSKQDSICFNQDTGSRITYQRLQTKDVTNIRLEDTASYV
jgi:hypothetical protein